MPELNLLVNGKTIHYKGIFSIDRLFSSLNKTLGDKGYGVSESKTEQMNTTQGRKFTIFLRASKGFSSYSNAMIKIKVRLENIIDTVKEVDGFHKEYQNADVVIVFDAWSVTDYESRWGEKPWPFFLKAFMNRYIKKTPLEGSWIGEIKSDAAYVYAQIRKHLNSYKRGDDHKVMSEEEIRKSVKKEIKEEVKRHKEGVKVNKN